MAKRWLVMVLAGLVSIALLVTWWVSLPGTKTTVQSSPVNTAITLADAQDDALAQLPVVLGPEATLTATATFTATVTATPTVTGSPMPGNNELENGGFEEGWTDLPPNPGNQINQQPNSWTLTWVEIGQPLYDDPNTLADGICECVHKLKDQLPPNEQPGGLNALILDGETTYKLFHGGARFGSELRQVVNLPPGSLWRLTIPVQTHLHGQLDPFGAESAAWVVLSDTEVLGGWANGGVMGDRRWFEHVVEFEAPANGQVIILIRVKSKWNTPKDFFVDAVRLEPGSNVRGDLAPGRARVFWGTDDYPDRVDYWGWLAESGVTPGLSAAETPTPSANPANE